MLQIELIPDLSHCIETIAKREYRETLRKLLASEEGNKELQERVEVLRAFLETMDFKKLRRESEKHLMRGREVKFIVYLQERKAKYELQLM